MVRILLMVLGGLFILGIAGAGAGVYVLQQYRQELPESAEIEKLRAYDPRIVTRVHAGDGRLLAEFATEKRVFVPIEAIPDVVVNAFIAAEDQNFYTHGGVDFVGVTRAAITNLKNIGTGTRPQGASTITQQVAKNFLLTNELSIDRKVKEALLAFRIEESFSKKEILELYLNEIYLGFGSYGVAAAALNYFNKSLSELSLEEAAYLAALPKAPNNYHPVKRREQAIDRRNYVIGRMVADGHIDQTTAEAAMATELATKDPADSDKFDAAYFTEDVRRELMELVGEEGVYGGGLFVHTTLDPRLQVIAHEVLREGLITYDRAHGWRGPITTLTDAESDWADQISDLQKDMTGLEDWEVATVLDVTNQHGLIGLTDGGLGIIPMNEMSWARPNLKDQRIGNRPQKPADVLGIWDVVLVELLEGPANDSAPGVYALRQRPDVQGALVALDPHTGDVLAMSGGFDAEDSEFNRASQAARQPGSAFKPFVYLRALEEGYTPASILLDAPVVIDQGAGLGKWKPSNYTHEFYGPTPFRVGIEKSRNLMTVRLAQAVGVRDVSEIAGRFGVIEDMDPLLAMALGSGETTPLALTAGYAQIVNGGKRIAPTLIDRIQDKRGNIIYRSEDQVCDACQATDWQPGFDIPSLPVIDDVREQIVDPRHAYQMVSILEGVVQRGTGSKIAALGRPLAGKTGTTNDAFDTWFVGFSPDLAVGVYVGFDQPRTLGPREGGSTVAAPIFQAFMGRALEGEPKQVFRRPSGLRWVRVDHATGQRVSGTPRGSILEAFVPGTEPTLVVRPLTVSGEGQGTTGLPAPSISATTSASTGTGGLY